MNKKILAITLILAISATSAFSVGIGLQAGGTVGKGGVLGGAAAITFKLDSNDLLFAVEIPSFNPLAVGVSADYWFFNKTIVGPLKWYVGAGLLGSVFIGDNVSFSIGAHAPIGLNAVFGGFFEPYIQVAPGFNIGLGNGVHPAFICHGNIGFRFWF